MLTSSQISRTKIVMIDHDLLAIANYADYLTDQGFQTFCATDAKSGLQMIEEHKPHLVILDILMPGIDGLNFLSEITRRFSNIPIMILTACADKEIAKLAIQRGACEFIPKPINPHAILKHFILPLFDPATHSNTSIHVS